MTPRGEAGAGGPEGSKPDHVHLMGGVGPGEGASHLHSPRPCRRCGDSMLDPVSVTVLPRQEGIWGGGGADGGDLLFGKNPEQMEHAGGGALQGATSVGGAGPRAGPGAGPGFQPWRDKRAAVGAQLLRGAGRPAEAGAGHTATQAAHSWPTGRKCHLGPLAPEGRVNTATWPTATHLRASQTRTPDVRSAAESPFCALTSLPTPP